MPVRRRAALLTFAVALVATLSLAVPAFGASGSPTKVVVSLKFPAFHGNLKSSREGCLGSRKVKLYRKKNGPDKLLGTDRSEDNGEWSIPVGKRPASGSYYVTVTARGKCKASKSKVIPVA